MTKKKGGRREKKKGEKGEMEGEKGYGRWVWGEEKVK